MSSWNKNVRGEEVKPLINDDAPVIRVEAGPGAGKTFGLVRRIERIMHPEGLNVSGKDVLVVAFNRVIAKQLEEDISKRLTTFEHDGEPRIRTIHALCLEVIGEDLRLLLPHEVEAMIYDVREQHEAIRDTYADYRATAQALRQLEAGHADDPKLDQAVRQWLKQHHAQLISDLPHMLLDRLRGGDFPEEQALHVLVDEFQDLTPGEQSLMFRLRADSGQLVALGDRRQSIYMFRGNDRLGLAKLTDLAKEAGVEVRDVVMIECQRCPAAVVRAANRLMALADAQEMTPTSEVAANLHAVVWSDPKTEAAGMARAIVGNIHANAKERHLAMVTRRDFGYWFRDEISKLDPNLKIDLSFSEGVLETWAVREAFLLFCLFFDADRPTWRGWFGYQNSETGKGFKAPSRNADAYLQLLARAHDVIDAGVVEALAAEPRKQRRGAGGAVIWDRAKRFVDLRAALLPDQAADINAQQLLEKIFDPDRWIGAACANAETARLDMTLLRDLALQLLKERQEKKAADQPIQHLRYIANRLRYLIGTREPFTEGGTFDLQVATLHGAKGVTAEHVYLLGAAKEAIPGEMRDEYPGTEAEYEEEQRRLFYVSITRSKKTLVISRARFVTLGEARRLGLAVGQYAPHMVELEMSPFLRDILKELPDAVQGDKWKGC